jgi:anti-sigma factor RsiW
MSPRDLWADRLSEYVDGELDPAARADAEAHLLACGRCAATVEELRAVQRRAAALGELPLPAQDLWPAIEARLEPRGGRRTIALPGRGWSARRWSLSLPQMAAAALFVMVLSSGGMWLALSRRPAPVRAGASQATVPALVTVQPAGFEATGYDAAIVDLEKMLAEHRSELDPKTVTILEQNLRIIDEATAQARKALAADPANRYLNDHLAEQLKRKMTILRQATAFVAVRG